MKYCKKLVGERIYLSPMSVDDAPTYIRWLNDFDVTNGLGSSSRVETLESEKAWITSNAGNPQFAIVRLSDDALLGNCGIQDIDQRMQRAELGLFIGDEENRGKGYGVEVLNLLLDFGFDYMNLNNILLKVYDFNEAAIACYKKVGFKEMGRRRQAYYLKGKFHDQVYMDILREERNSSR